MNTGLVIWDIDGTLIPADLRWLRRAVARTYELDEKDIVFPTRRVHGYTDESIVVDTAIESGIERAMAEQGVRRFHVELATVMAEGEAELARDQPAYPGAAESIDALHQAGFVQTVLTGNVRAAAEVKLRVAGLDQYLDLDIGAFGSDDRDRFALPAIVSQRFTAQYGSHLTGSNAVIVGDAQNDIACARYAGFQAIAVAHRLSSTDLAEYSPDAILERFTPDAVVATVKSLLSASKH